MPVLNSKKQPSCPHPWGCPPPRTGDGPNKEKVPGLQTDRKTRQDYHLGERLECQLILKLRQNIQAVLAVSWSYGKKLYNLG